MKTLYIDSLDQIDKVAKEFLATYSNDSVIAFYGEMGAGKTTFIKALCKALKIEDTVNSPSFAIVNEYHNAKDDIVYHFDFYRLKDEEEAYDMGYEDYLYSGHLCVIEWPEKIEALLPDRFVLIKIQVETPDLRRFEIDIYE